MARLGLPAPAPAVERLQLRLDARDDGRPEDGRVDDGLVVLAVVTVVVAVVVIIVVVVVFVVVFWRYGGLLPLQSGFQACVVLENARHDAQDVQEACLGRLGSGVESPGDVAPLGIVEEETVAGDQRGNDLRGAVKSQVSEQYSVFG